jgi:hypothetical protein
LGRRRHCPQKAFAVSRRVFQLAPEWRSLP